MEDTIIIGTLPTGIWCTGRTFCPYRLDQLYVFGAISSSSILRPHIYKNHSSTYKLGIISNYDYVHTCWISQGCSDLPISLPKFNENRHLKCNKFRLFHNSVYVVEFVLKIIAWYLSSRDSTCLPGRWGRWCWGQPPARRGGAPSTTPPPESGPPGLGSRPR